MKDRVREYTLSNENIYLAIYCLDSYIFNPELLDQEDGLILLHQLKDKFNFELLFNEAEGIIPAVRKRIADLLDQPKDFVKAKVYFRPKKYKTITEGSEKIKGNIEFRPLHTASIIDQIALVALLNIFIYEIPEDNNKLVLSNLSKLIPSNFYGNRVSLKPEVLFKPWNEQYKEYTQQANQRFKEYHESKEYTHEVKLDLENFFPSINPMILYKYIMERLPVIFNENELETYKKALVKLLFCHVINLDPENIRRYYGEGIEPGKPYFTMGIPQGLPQSYFLGNICMIEVSNIFNRVFEGISLYYVDDSVIFTKNLTSAKFDEKLKEINDRITESITGKNEVAVENKNLKDIISMGYKDIFNFLFAIKGQFCIRVHEQGDKSTCTEIALASDGEIWLRQISREVSQAGFDINTVYSDEEDNIVKKRMTILADAISKEKKRIEELIESQQNESTYRDELESYRDKLVRYYKFFSYRKLKLELKEKTEIDDVFHMVADEANEPLEKFIKHYKEGIWEVALSICKKDSCDEKKRELRNLILKINRELFGYPNKSSSYIYQSNKLFLEEKEEAVFVDKYGTLNYLFEYKVPGIGAKHTNIINKMIEDELKENHIFSWEKYEMVFSRDFIDTIKLVDANTNEMKRMALNAKFSKMFGVELSDSFIIENMTKKTLLYGELRLLAFVRNKHFTEKLFRDMQFDLSDRDNQLKIDYTIMEVLDCFKTFISDPVKIDFLIRIHQYTCDIWKNGSKYLYFYTLHNQDHAIDLIKNIIKLVKAISYIQISHNDYYVLFIACYLHDISMVKIPSKNVFLLDNEDADSIAMNFMEDLRKIEEDKKLDDINKEKELLEKYHRMIDEFFEKSIRSKHAKESAEEILWREDLNFLESCLREMVAQVAEGHGQDAKDIYYVRSDATHSVVSLKFDKILLRLADLLDMSSYRVSRPILNHNIEQMSKISAFHWISHLLTNRYELETDYHFRTTVSELGYLAPEQIVEVLVFRIFVNFNQLSGIENEKKCSKISLQSITGQKLELLCGEECEEPRCNFLCKWFTQKNDFLVNELSELKSYLNRTPGKFYTSDIKIELCIEENRANHLTAQQFEIIKEQISM